MRFIHKLKFWGTAAGASRNKFQSVRSHAHASLLNAGRHFITTMRRRPRPAAYRWRFQNNNDRLFQFEKSTTKRSNSSQNSQTLCSNKVLSCPDDRWWMIRKCSDVSCWKFMISFWIDNFHDAVLCAYYILILFVIINQYTSISIYKLIEIFSGSDIVWILVLNNSDCILMIFDND